MFGFTCFSALGTGPRFSGNERQRAVRAADRCPCLQAAVARGLTRWFSRGEKGDLLGVVPHPSHQSPLEGGLSVPCSSIEQEFEGGVVADDRPVGDRSAVPCPGGVVSRLAGCRRGSTDREIR